MDELDRMSIDDVDLGYHVLTEWNAAEARAARKAQARK